MIIFIVCIDDCLLLVVLMRQHQQMYGWCEVAQVLIECNVNCKTAAGATPLCLACLSGNLDLIKYLSGIKGCDSNHKNNGGKAEIHYACFRGCMNVLKYLLYEKHIVIQCAKIMMAAHH